MYDDSPLKRKMNDVYRTLCMTMLISKCVGVMSLRIHAKGDTRGSRQGGRDKLRKGGPHDTEGV